MSATQFAAALSPRLAARWLAVIRVLWRSTRPISSAADYPSIYRTALPTPCLPAPIPPVRQTGYRHGSSVRLPAIGGFDVVEQIGLTHLPPTIFVTAYHEHAVRAFEVQAIDYLTKPIDPQQLETALSRVREKVAAKTALLTQAQFAVIVAGLSGTDARNAAFPDYTARLLIKDGEKEILLPVEKVDWIEAAEYYCCICSRGRRYMLRETLSDLADRLNPKQFVRIHRSSIVNIDQIKAIYRDGGEEGSVSLLDGRNLRMSKTGRRRLPAHSKD